MYSIVTSDGYKTLICKHLFSSLFFLKMAKNNGKCGQLIIVLSIVQCVIYFVFYFVKWINSSIHSNAKRMAPETMVSHIYFQPVYNIDN